MAEGMVGSIYVLTNPAIKDYVKIGYADDVDDRVRVLKMKNAQKK